MKFSDAIIELIDKHGGKVVADEIGVDNSALSRFRSGHTGMTLEKLDRLLQFSGYTLMTKNHHRDTKKAVVTIAAMLKEEMGL